MLFACLKTAGVAKAQLTPPSLRLNCKNIKINNIRLLWIVPLFITQLSYPFYFLMMIMNDYLK